MQSEFTHRSVLLDEAIEALAVRPDGCYLDGTFGRGGHTAALLAALGPEGRVLALDRDPEAEAWARRRFGDDPRLTFQRGRFGELAQWVHHHGLEGRLDGILLDVGVSSPQLDDPRRGFSFSQDGPLDMRMDPDCGSSAAQWLAGASEDEIVRVLRELGEERFARRIARAVVERRREAPVTTTGQLARLVSEAVPTREPGKHPATRSFQAIRIHINRELEELAGALEQAVRVLAPRGRLVVISFHSLEDRIVKRFIRSQSRGRELPLDLPVTDDQTGATLRLIGRSQRAGSGELAVNPRARSAVLRAAEKL